MLHTASAYLRTIFFLLALLTGSPTICAQDAHPGTNEMPMVTNSAERNYFPMVDSRGKSATIYLSEGDYPVVNISAGLLADDIERVTGKHVAVQQAATIKQIKKCPAIVVGTIGHLWVSTRRTLCRHANVALLSEANIAVSKEVQ